MEGDENALADVMVTTLLLKSNTVLLIDELKK